MSKLKFDQTGERLYETGTKYGVVYPYSKEALTLSLTDATHGISSTQSHYGKGAAWNGLTGVTESPSGADATDLYADDMKYLSIRAAETFGGTIEAYTYPDEVAVLNGEVELTDGMIVSQQSRGVFGFCYRTVVGNDTEFNEHGYKLHLVYGATMSPSERGYSTINDSPEAITFSWEFETTPISFEVGGKQYNGSLITIDTTKLATDKKDNIKLLEACLYGTEDTDAFLPLPDEVQKILTYSEAV